MIIVERPGENTGRCVGVLLVVSMVTGSLSIKFPLPLGSGSYRTFKKKVGCVLVVAV